MHLQAEIALSPNLPSEIAHQLATLGPLSVARPDAAHGSRIWACSPDDAVDASLISRLPASLELIAVAGSSTDHIDLQAARARGIKVSRTPVSAPCTVLSLKANIAAFLDRGVPLDRV